MKQRVTKILLTLVLALLMLMTLFVSALATEEYNTKGELDTGEVIILDEDIIIIGDDEIHDDDIENLTINDSDDKALEEMLIDFEPFSTTPGAPRNVRTTAGNGTATIHWDPPTNAATTVAGYQASRNGTTWFGVNSSIRSYTFTGLTNGTQVTLRVRAIGNRGENSTIVSATATPRAPSLSLSQSTWNPSHLAGNTTVTVTPTNVSSWSVSSNATSWLTVTVTGTNTFRINATANPGGQRTGTISVTASGATTRTVSVTQSAAPNLTVSPTTWSSASAASNTTITVTPTNVSSWNVSSNATSWLTATVTASNSFRINTTANTATTSRSGTITVTGGGLTRTVAVTQAAAPPLTLSPASHNFESTGGTARINVSTNSNIIWGTPSSNVNWVRIANVSPPTRTGNGHFDIIADPNPLTTSRSGAITVIAGTSTRTMTITQTASPPLTLSPTTWSINSSGGSTTINVTAIGGTWSNPTSNAGWLRITNINRTNNTFTITADPNPEISQRNGTISVTVGTTTRTVAVTQLAAPPLTLTPSSWTVDSSGGRRTIAVSTNSNIVWATPSSNVNWLRIEGVAPPTRTGNGQFEIVASPNTGSTSRTGTITVAAGTSTRIVTVTQGAAPTLTLTFGEWIPVGGTTPTDDELEIDTGISDPDLEEQHDASDDMSDDIDHVTDPDCEDTDIDTRDETVHDEPDTEEIDSVSEDENPEPVDEIVESEEEDADDDLIDEEIHEIPDIMDNSLNPETPEDDIIDGTVEIAIEGTSETFQSITNPWAVESFINVSVTSNVSWNATSSATSWLTVSNQTATSFRINTTANTGAQRSGTITVTGGGLTRTVTVTQTAAPILTLLQTEWRPSSLASTETVTVTSNVSWNVTSNAPSWLTVSNQSATSFRINTTANTGTQRSGTITVTGGGLSRTVTVTQTAESTLTLSQSTWNPSYLASNVQVRVETNASSWNATSSDPTWLSFTATGPETFNINATVNTRGQRIGTITVTAGGLTRTVEVTQAAAPPTLTLTPNIWNVPSSASNTTIRVDTNSSWADPLSSDPTQFRITNIIKTPVGGVFTIEATSNPTNQIRHGEISVTAGATRQTVSISQAAPPVLIVTFGEWLPVLPGNITPTDGELEIDIGIWDPDLEEQLGTDPTDETADDIQDSSEQSQEPETEKTDSASEDDIPDSEDEIVDEEPEDAIQYEEPNVSEEISEIPDTIDNSLNPEITEDGIMDGIIETTEVTIDASTDSIITITNPWAIESYTIVNVTSNEYWVPTSDSNNFIISDIIRRSDGTGGTFKITARANTGNTSQTGTITVTVGSITRVANVEQDPRFFEISQDLWTPGSQHNVITIPFRTNVDIRLDTRSTSPWLNINHLSWPLSPFGHGAMTLSVEPHSGSTHRDAAIMVGTSTIIGVRQAPQPPPLIWRSTVDSVGYWLGNEILVQPIIHESIIGGHDFSARVREACNEWSRALNVTVRMNWSSGINVEAHLAPRSVVEAAFLAEFGRTMQSRYLGFAQTQTEGPGSINIDGKSRTVVRQHGKLKFYVVDGLDSDMARIVTTHELGHSLGYHGHSYSDDEVMNGEPIHHTISENEKRHLKQIYDRYR